MTIVLAGNPNSGKTTLFNELTGTSQHTGNYPGVTIEVKEGILRLGKEKVRIVDLPGIYSLDPDTAEQRVANDYLRDNNIDLIVNIVDAGNLERSLSLSIRLIGTGRPILMALNMIDEVEKSGDRIDAARLQFLLGIPVVPISASKHRNISELKSHIDDAVRGKLQPNASPGLCAGCAKCGDGGNLFEHIEDIARQVYFKKQSQNAKDLTRRLDAVFLNRWLAIPVFLLIMFGIFYATFAGTGWLSNGIRSGLFSLAVPAFQRMLGAIGAPLWVMRLIVDGIVPGVGNVLTFLPQIAVLFILMSVMEDSGYMARAAFIMDRAFSRIGLGGGAFMPLLMGFGCSVPGVMAARSLPTERERKLTVMLVPFMSCSARLPLYVLMAGTFFAGRQGLVIFSIYVIGILVAVLSGWILSRFLWKKERSAFIMEMPPYRLPSLKSVLLHSWDKVSGFLTRAGTILLGASIVIWALQYFTPAFMPASDPSASILAAIGRAISVILIPIGLGDWRAGVALTAGIAAKEAIVSAFGVLTGGLNGSIRSVFTPLQAYVMMLFTLLYMPCVAAIAAIRKEMGSLKWTSFTILYAFAVAYVLCLAVYGAGRLLGF